MTLACVTICLAFGLCGIAARVDDTTQSTIAVIMYTTSVTLFWIAVVMLLVGAIMYLTRAK
jgi:hypothetical protein